MPFGRPTRKPIRKPRPIRFYGAGYSHPESFIERNLSVLMGLGCLGLNILGLLLYAAAIIGLIALGAHLINSGFTF